MSAQTASYVPGRMMRASDHNWMVGEEEEEEEASIGI